jgi:ribosomal protein S8
MAKLYTTALPDGSRVAWRPLTWNEFGDLTRRYSKEDVESRYTAWRLYSEAVELASVSRIQNGEEVAQDDLFAGTVVVVGQQILRESGFISDYEVIKSQRNRARNRILGDWYEEIATYIMAMFRIPEAELREWTLDRFMDYAVRVEQIVGQDLLAPPSEEQPGANNVTYRVVNGQRIPVVTKADLKAQRRVDVSETPASMERDYRPVDQPSQPQPDLPQMGQRRVHPLTQRINDIKARRGLK